MMTSGVRAAMILLKITFDAQRWHQDAFSASCLISVSVLVEVHPEVASSKAPRGEVASHFSECCGGRQEGVELALDADEDVTARWQDDGHTLRNFRDLQVLFLFKGIKNEAVDILVLLFQPEWNKRIIVAIST
jgi:hypothetical protein